MNALSLFSGIGGIDLAAEWAGIKTVAMCEREPFCQKVLKKHWPDVPIYDDVKTLTKERLEADGVGTIELIHGGYPCQPFSYSGDRKGENDDRHLWPEVRRLIEAIRPRWFVGENVDGHVTLGLDNVLSDLDTIGYTARTFVLPACAVNAPHRRYRVFIVGYAKRCGRSGDPWRWAEQLTTDGYIQLEEEYAANTAGEGLSIGRRSNGSESQEETGTGLESESERCSEDVADTQSERCRETGKYQSKRTTEWTSSCSEDVSNASSIRQQRQRELIQSFDTETDRIRQAGESLDVRIRDQWAAEPDVGRVANGVPDRVDRLKSLGNAVVPQQIYPVLAAVKHIDDKLKEINHE